MAVATPTAPIPRRTPVRGSANDGQQGVAPVKRIYIFSAGVALGVASTRRTRRAKEAARAALAAKLTPSAIAADVADAIAELGNAVGSFAADVRQGAENRRNTYRPMIESSTGAVHLVAPDQLGPAAAVVDAEAPDGRRTA